MDKVTGFYIEPALWKEELETRNKGERARFFTKSFLLDNLDGVDAFECTQDVPYKNKWDHRDFLFTITSRQVDVLTSTDSQSIEEVKELHESYSNPGIYERYCSHAQYDPATKHKAWKLTYKVAVLDEHGCIFDYGTEIYGNTNPYNDFISPLCKNDYTMKGQFNPMSKALYTAKMSSVTHLDKYGVQIAIGDVIVHSDANGYMDVQIVDKISPDKVNGYEPRRLIVIRTNDATKKLEWGLNKNGAPTV